MENEILEVPVGMNDLGAILKDICKKKTGYQRISPVHFILPVSAGNGQTTATRFVAESLQAGGVRRFGGLELFLEYRLDGTMDQMKKIFHRNIRENAVYTNDYEGVISFDITALSPHSKGIQTSFFIEEVRKISTSATLIFFVGENPTPGLLNIVGKLKASIRNLQVVQVNAYSVDELAWIIEKELAGRNICMVPEDNFHAALCEIVKHRQAETVRDALSIMEEAAISADYSEQRPVLHVSDFPVVFSDCYGEEKTKK